MRSEERLREPRFRLKQPRFELYEPRFRRAVASRRRSKQLSYFRRHSDDSEKIWSNFHII